MVIEKKREKVKHICIPKAIKAAAANMSAIANGKLERICKVFLLSMLSKPKGPPFFFFELCGTSPVSPLVASSSVRGGEEASDKIIFWDTLFPLFSTSWELFSLQLMVNGSLWALFAAWPNGLNLKKGWKIGTLRKWVLGRHGFVEFMTLKAFMDPNFGNTLCWGFVISSLRVTHNDHTSFFIHMLDISI